MISCKAVFLKYISIPNQKGAKIAEYRTEFGRVRRGVRQWSRTQRDSIMADCGSKATKTSQIKLFVTLTPFPVGENFSSSPFWYV